MAPFGRFLPLRYKWHGGSPQNPIVEYHRSWAIFWFAQQPWQRPIRSVRVTQQNNPYSAPQPEATSSREDRQIPSFTIRLAKWAFICGLSGIPSFILAMTLHSSEKQILAMAVGIFIFSVMYAVLEGTHYVQSLLDDSAIRGLAYFTYGCRLGCSVIFPIGMFLDCIPGMYSVDLVENLYGNY
ncbi:MAG: hypothetical protein ACI9HK_004573, partial [Pirellulaceae bacterium]